MMDEVLSKCTGKMEKTIAALEHEFGTIRAGRANASVLDRIQVDYYGVPTAIQQMAAISVVEARSLLIQPWDISTLRAIEKAIQASDIGINPMNDGKVIRLNFPPLTEERRRELVKSVRKYAEEAKIAVRSVRRDTIEKYKVMKKNAEITEDDLKENEKEVQNVTDRFCKDIDLLCEAKEKEVMEL